MSNEVFNKFERVGKLKVLLEQVKSLKTVQQIPWVVSWLTKIDGDESSNGEIIHNPIFYSIKESLSSAISYEIDKIVAELEIDGHIDNEEDEYEEEDSE